MALYEGPEQIAQLLKETLLDYPDKDDHGRSADIMQLRCWL